MGLLSEILLFPLAPARLTRWTVERVVEAAVGEHCGPERIRRELAELARQFDAGLISAEEFDSLEDELLDRLAEGQRAGTG